MLAFFVPPCTDKIQNPDQVYRGRIPQTNAIFCIFLALLEVEKDPKIVRRLMLAFFVPPCTNKIRITNQVDRGGNP